MKYSLDKYISFHKKNGGTGKLFNFKLISYSQGKLELEGEFNDFSLNPDGSVQGGMMTAMLDDVTSLLFIYEARGKEYPNSTNLHTIHHRPLFEGKAIATAEIIKKGKNIVTIKGELYNTEGKLSSTLIHSAMIMKSDFNM